MANVKLALAVVFLTTLVMSPMKKVEACERAWCHIGDRYACGYKCGCIAYLFLAGNCIFHELTTKAVEEHTNLCHSHNDCIKKGSGSFCAYYPNSDLQHGWCFASNIEAERYFEVLSNPAIGNILKNATNTHGKGFLKMPLESAT